MGKLTKVEISFLRWLYNQGGKCALSENDDLSTYYRLVKAGYVEVQLPDRFNPAVVNFKLTESGQGALEAAAGHPVAQLAPADLRNQLPRRTELRVRRVGGSADRARRMPVGSRWWQ